METHTETGWLEERNACTAAAETIVFKVGSAVITGDAGLQSDVMERLAAQMVAVRDMLPGRRIILVTSAAVAAGRAVLQEAGKESPGSLSAKQAIAAIGQCRLMQAWDRAFRPHGLPTAQVLLTREDMHARKRFLNIRNTFAELLGWQVLPIVNENDTVSVEELKFGDNDSLSSLLANLVEADLCVNLTSARGVMAEDPQKNPAAALLTHIDDIEAVDLTKMCGSKTNAGTGGMYSKLRAARRTAQIGVPTLILPGRESDVLRRAFETGSTLGTWIRRNPSPIPRRKYWLAYQTPPAGSVFVDAGAARALLTEGRSLLPGGIVKVEGNFQKGALIKVLHGEDEIGVGLSNYSAQEIQRIMGLKRHEVAACLGNAHYPDVIHRDNFLLHAVV